MFIDRLGYGFKGAFISRLDAQKLANKGKQWSNNFVLTGNLANQNTVGSFTHKGLLNLIY